MNPLEWSAILKEGGVTGLALIYLAWLLYDSRNATAEALRRLSDSDAARMQELRGLMTERLEDQRKHSDQLAEVAKTFDRALDVMEAKRNV